MMTSQQFRRYLYIYFSISKAQTESQGNRSMHVRESYRSADVWQSPIITAFTVYCRNVSAVHKKKIISEVDINLRTALNSTHRPLTNEQSADILGLGLIRSLLTLEQAQPVKKQSLTIKTTHYRPFYSSISSYICHLSKS